MPAPASGPHPPQGLQVPRPGRSREDVHIVVGRPGTRAQRSSPLRPPSRIPRRIAPRKSDGTSVCHSSPSLPYTAVSQACSRLPHRWLRLGSFRRLGSAAPRAPRWQVCSPRRTSAAEEHGRLASSAREKQVRDMAARTLRALCGASPQAGSSCGDATRFALCVIVQAG